MKKVVKVYDQGDVGIIKNQPNNLITVSGKKQDTYVVQEGEHTGHAHRFLDGNVDIYQQEDRKFLKVLKGGSTITHEEHLPITIEEGEYEVRIVRQVDPFSKIVSKVVD